MMTLKFQKFKQAISLNMEQVPDIANCSICAELFSDPRWLPCIHTFCLKCLDSTANNQLKPGNAMPCPLCKNYFVIPMRGMVGLEKNIFMKNLVEKIKVSREPKQVVKLCEVCMADDEAETNLEFQPSAEWYCTQCQQRICDKCRREHERFKGLRDHQVIPIGDYTVENMIKQVEIQFCDQHNKEQLNLYCFKCQKAICTMCLAVVHSSHDYGDIEEAAAHFREDILDDVLQIEYCLDEANEKHNELTEEHDRFCLEVQKIENEIFEKGCEAKNIIDKYVGSLLDKLSSLKQNGLKQIEAEKEESKRYLTIMEGLNKYYNEFSCLGSATDVCRDVQALRNKAANQNIGHTYYMLRPIPSLKISFQGSKCDDFIDGAKIIGTIKDFGIIGGTIENRRPPVIWISMGRSVSFKKSSNSFACSVLGVTKVKNEIYVLVSDPSSIIVLDDESFKQKNTILLMKVGRPFDLVSCKEMNCLYVTDGYDIHRRQGTRSVFKITTNSFPRIERLIHINAPYFQSISTDQLIMIDRCQSTNLLQIFASDGNLIRSFPLPPEIQRPTFAVRKSNGEFIIGHKDQSTGQWCISQICNEGYKVTARFRPRKISEELNFPCHFAIDSANNRLFVADHFNHRVVLFDANTLQIIKVLLTKERNDIFYPFRLCYDENKKQLIVSHSDGVMTVYKLSYI